MENKTNGLHANTFGIVVGVVLAAAVAMFVGLYLLGSQNATSTFDDGYDTYTTDDATYYYDDYYYDYSSDEFGEYMFTEDDFYYDMLPEEDYSFYETGDYTEFYPEADTQSEVIYYYEDEAPFYFDDTNTNDYEFIGE